MTSPDPAAVVGAILFSDLVGFTEFNGAVGDAAALALLERQTEIVNDVIGRCSQARLVKELGDGLMLWFGSATDAVSCALAIIETIDRDRAAETFPLAVRMGAHHGPAIARGDDLVGQAVNIAARICDLAGPGELLVSDELIAACDRLTSPAQPLGAAQVKGVADPVWLHRLTSSTRQVGRVG
jgi:adenylate cyclase